MNSLISQTVGALVIYMVAMASPVIEEPILEKWFGRRIDRYYAELAYVRTLLFLAFIALIDIYENRPVCGDCLARIAAIALVFAVVHKFIILRKAKKCQSGPGT